MHVSASNSDYDCKFYVAGRVSLHATAIIADGVLLQADPGCRLIVGAGACVGTGSILHASQGILEIGADVTIGDHVLIVGSGQIGANACVGSHSTVIGESLQAGAVLSSHSLVISQSWQVNGGASHRSTSVSSNDDIESGTAHTAHAKRTDSTVNEDTDADISRDVWESAESSIKAEADVPVSGSAEAIESVEASAPVDNRINAENGVTAAPDSSSSSAGLAHQSQTSSVYGRDSVNRLIRAMFPYHSSHQIDSDGSK